MAFKIDESVVDKHVRIVLNSNFEDVFETSDYYNIRCNVCGDSTKDKFKKRGFILKSSDPWVYYCHNCGTSTTAIKWLKEYYPFNYKNLMIDVMRNNKQSGDNISFKKSNPSKPRDEKEDTKYFKPLTQFDDCVEYCVNRNIDESVYSKWFYATGGIYSGRIIITFRNNATGKIYYYQGRAFNTKSNSIKYMSRFGDHNAIYNYYNVDKTKPVPVLEGPIDSGFVDNSIAVTGLKLSDNLLSDFPHLYFLLDNDESAYKHAHKLIGKNMYVFNWTKFLKKYKCTSDVKDVNDFINTNTNGITKLSWDMIKDYFTNKIADKLYFPIKKKKNKFI